MTSPCKLTHLLIVITDQITSSKMVSDQHPPPPTPSTQTSGSSLHPNSSQHTNIPWQQTEAGQTFSSDALRRSRVISCLMASLPQMLNTPPLSINWNERRHWGCNRGGIYGNGKLCISNAPNASVWCSKWFTWNITTIHNLIFIVYYY